MEQINSEIILGIYVKCIKINIYIYIIYLWLHWVFVAACGLSLGVGSRGYSSLRWLLLLRSMASRHTGSVVVLRVLECRLISCGAQA